jgi:spermidine synthase
MTPDPAGPAEGAEPRLHRSREVWLLAATFLVAVAGLIYELIAATLSSYLLGDSIRQFSMVIGIFLAAMGLGAWLSRFVARALPGFIWAQIGLGLIGGFMAPILYFSYALTGVVEGPLFASLIAVGALSGMEIPLIARILKEIGAPQFRFENVLSVDYVGALVASLLFPTLILPHLGLMSAGLAFGTMNLAVAGLSLWIFRDEAPRAALWVWALALALTLTALWQAERMVSAAESRLYDDDIILTEQSPWQRITVTRFRDRTRLFLDGSIQFDSMDEYRYHEALVHPAMGLVQTPRRVLILGGGDGLAAREVLKHPEVESITLVDLDPMVTDLFRDHPQLSTLNLGALRDPRVTILNMDAWKYAETSGDTFDVIIADLPDPKSVALSKLYSREFYAMVVGHLAPRGALVVQAGSPLFARDAFWSVIGTLRSSRNPLQPEGAPSVLPYHVFLPSFGDWGFGLVTLAPLQGATPTLPPGLRYLTPETWAAAQAFAPDVADSTPQINTLRSHALVGYYDAGWDRWFR